MFELTPTHMVIWLISQLVVAAAIWGGIRADLRAMHSRVKRVEDAVDKAHGRIDHSYYGQEKRILPRDKKGL